MSDASNIAVPVEQTRDERFIGASEAAAALGCDPHKAPIDVWRRLRGEPSDERTVPEFVREASEWGHIIEPVVRGAYAVKRKVAVAVPKASLVHPAAPVRCTPDGLVLREAMLSAVVKAGDTFAADVLPPLGPVLEALNPKGAQWALHCGEVAFAGLVQVKTCSADAWRRWEGVVPSHYEIQCRVEMAVCGLPWNDAAVLVGGQKFVIQRFERDPAIEERILDDLAAFMKLAESGALPTVDDAPGWRREIFDRMKKAEKLTLNADEALVETLVSWRTTRKALSDATTMEKTLANSILLHMSAAGVTQVDAGEIGKTTAYQSGAGIDWKGLALSLGANEKAIPELFRRKATGWSLRAPQWWSKEDEEER